MTWLGTFDGAVFNGEWFGPEEAEGDTGWSSSWRGSTKRIAGCGAGRLLSR